VFEDLLQEDSLRSSMLVLDKEYETINAKGELDERLFANDEGSLIGSDSISGGAIYLPDTKVTNNVLIHPLHHNLNVLILFKICIACCCRESMMLWSHLQNQ
jgi:hypothetical protein